MVSLASFDPALQARCLQRKSIFPVEEELDYQIRRVCRKFQGKQFIASCFGVGNQSCSLGLGQANAVPLSYT